MNITNIKNYDFIIDLPSDENPVSENETKIVNMLFKEKVNPKGECKLNDFIDVLIIGVLFVVLSLPYFDTFMRTIIIFPENRALYIILLIKTLLMMILFWIIKHYGKKLF